MISCGWWSDSLVKKSLHCSLEKIWVLQVMGTFVLQSAPKGWSSSNFSFITRFWHSFSLQQLQSCLMSYPGPCMAAGIPLLFGFILLRSLMVFPCKQSSDTCFCFLPMLCYISGFVSPFFPLSSLLKTSFHWASWAWCIFNWDKVHFLSCLHTHLLFLPVTSLLFLYN